jgi:tyrosyl-tRNA synthetase
MLNFIKKLFKKKSIRNTKEYRLWKKLVKNRDKVCMKCGVNINLHAHHILNFNEYKDLQIDTNNGITLCGNCHTLFHKKYGRKNNNAIQIIKFINTKR